MNKEKIFVPFYLLNSGLPQTEVLLLCIIAAHETAESGCELTNKEFSECLNIGQNRVSRCISSLHKKGYIYSEAMPDPERGFTRRIVVLDEQLRNMMLEIYWKP